MGNTQQATEVAVIIRGTVRIEAQERAGKLLSVIRVAPPSGAHGVLDKLLRALQKATPESSQSPHEVGHCQPGAEDKTEERPVTCSRCHRQNQTSNVTSALLFSTAMCHGVFQGTQRCIWRETDQNGQIGN